MNKAALKMTHRNLSGWLTKCHEQTVPDSKKLEIIMHSLADICLALYTDGTQESANEFFEDEPPPGSAPDY